MDREPGVMLWTAEAWTQDEESYEAWVAEYGDHHGVGATRAEALLSLSRSLGDDEVGLGEIPIHGGIDTDAGRETEDATDVIDRHHDRLVNDEGNDRRTEHLADQLRYNPTARLDIDDADSLMGINRALIDRRMGGSFDVDLSGEDEDAQDDLRDALIQAFLATPRPDHRESMCPECGAINGRVANWAEVTDICGSCGHEYVVR
jgi:hypothetical protein